MSDVILDVDKYASEDDKNATTGSGKFYTVRVPQFKTNDPAFDPAKIAKALDIDPSAMDMTWPPYASWGGTDGAQNMSSYLRMGRTPSLVKDGKDGWKLADVDPSKQVPPEFPSADDARGLLTAAAMIEVLDWRSLPDLINFCGHREHTDGHRIISTYGHHVNIVNGDYHNITLAQAKWEHDHPSEWGALGYEKSNEETEEGIANHFLACDIYYDVMSTWYFPNKDTRVVGEPPVPFHPKMTDGNKWSADPAAAGSNTKGTTYDDNHNLVPDYYEYINAENLRSTACVAKGDIEKTFAGKHIYMVCTRYGDNDHTHSEQDDYPDWSDGDLWDHMCAKNYRDTTTATGNVVEIVNAGGDIKESSTAGGDISSHENATGTISETTRANLIMVDEEAVAFTEQRFAKAGIDALTIAGAEISELTITGGANLDAKITGGANVDISSAAIGLDVTVGGVLVEMTAAVGAIVEVAAAGAALVSIDLSPLHVELALGLKRIEKMNERIDTTPSKKEINKQLARIHEDVETVAYRAKKLGNKDVYIFRKYEVL